jgi:hypothetical protein
MSDLMYGALQEAERKEELLAKMNARGSTN